MEHELAETYFTWLASEAFDDARDRREYEGVLRQLHDIPFYWTMISDDNRVGDAHTFRQYEFLEQQHGLDRMDQVTLGQWATAAPSALEVLMAIARRWDYYFGGPSVAYYFWHLFHNMGFDRYPGRHLAGVTLDRLREKVDIWMSRRFAPNGEGSPFPIHALFDAVDMTKVDIWGQMNAYSAEHFQ